MIYHDKYQFLLSQEESFKTSKIEVAGGYFWSFFEHVMTTVLYMNSQFIKSKDPNKPFKNIIRPILNLQKRAEGFDVKDIEIYVNDAKKYFLSFLIRKYHDVWARTKGLDTLIDQIVESYVDFGGVLVKKLKTTFEVVPLQRIAFCDQTDILSGAICEKHHYTPSELIATAKELGWDIDTAKTLAELCELEKKENYADTESATPTPYIEVYELHGELPAEWLSDEDYEENTYVRQVQFCAFYNVKVKEAYSKAGVTLFSSYEKEPRYKYLSRDVIFGRALGMGGAEELFQDQIWTNYAEIHKKNLMDSASKTIFQTQDANYASRNNLNNLGNNSVLVHAPGAPLSQVNTFPVNFQLFEKTVSEWQAHAQQMGAANDAIMGESPKSGTPFRLQELVTSTSNSMHEFRKGKIATFLYEIYRDWIIPSLAKEVLAGREFLAELDLDELQSIAEQITNNQAQRMVKEKILNGELIIPEEIASFKESAMQEFLKQGNKRFLTILENEFKGIAMDLTINIAGKQHYSSQHVEKLNNVFMVIAKNPAVLQDPVMGKLLNQILEASGLDQMNFAQVSVPQTPQAPQLPQIPSQPIPA